MNTKLILLHVFAGTIGLISGAIALSAAKGATLHRRSGMLFVYTMLTMSLTGAVIAAFTGVTGSVIAGLLTAYLVITALTTVRPLAPRWLNLGAMLMALAVGLASVTLGFDSLANGEATRGGAPAPVLFIFGAIALLAGISDVRVMRSGGLRGVRRLARHLWRMCFALFIASGSFFLGQADKFPASLRIIPLLIILALAPLVALLYWLWRVRFRRTNLETITARSPEVIWPENDTKI